MPFYKPKEIADELGISTSALRHYESWGVVPAPERSANGYRLYTQVHLAYFRCLRAMFPGFGYAVTYEVLRHVQNGELDAALWLVNAEQVKLMQEKKTADETLAMLENPELPIENQKKLKPVMTIGEVAEATHVEPSAIRHWEKEGVLTPDRNPENGYRLYTPKHVRQVLLIRSLRTTVFFLDKIKEIVQVVENQSIDHARKLLKQALAGIHQRNRRQYIGIQKLMELCIEVGLMGADESAEHKPIHTFDSERDR